MEQTENPATMSAERMAQYLRWLLSNHNADISIDDDSIIDIAVDTDGEGPHVKLFVQIWHGDTQSTGRAELQFTVTASSDTAFTALP